MKTQVSRQPRQKKGLKPFDAEPSSFPATCKSLKQQSVPGPKWTQRHSENSSSASSCRTTSNGKCGKCNSNSSSPPKQHGVDGQQQPRKRVHGVTGNRRHVKRKASHLRWNTGPAHIRAQKLQFIRRIARQGGLRIRWDDWYKELLCQFCQKGDQAEQMLICDGCDAGYHMHCMRPILVSYPSGSWYCKDCCVAVGSPATAFEDHAKSFQKNQSTILRYFKLVPNPNDGHRNNHKKVKNSFNAHAAKHRQCFRLAVPVQNAMQRMMQLATFASAMKVNGMMFVARFRLQHVELIVTVCFISAVTRKTCRIELDGLAV